ncbi:alpha/beta fold hydrolase [Mycetocola spongiae]|uniref:alpha/beta fold hydrolase n=1 Tax=Mycetocola spongiae TaxID=2859226 RepID=UPI001CF2855A|nr:alpha/beta fold hydrolase [Mycetocola spongiae]UCR89071.1 alpha/beta hydrolase [Mycetocola spongiae]
MSEYIIPGAAVRDHTLSVPLDWSAPGGETIEIFAREVVDPARRDQALPVLVFLQGGPGGKSPRPAEGGGGWLTEALKTHRVILVDQRGTGRSTPARAERFAAMSGAEGAAYLLCFRADSIINDLEALRTRVFGGVRWETLGQSYGGFLTLTYLSRHPEAVAASYITGGLVNTHADALTTYRHTTPRALAKSRAYYRRYPEDRERFAALADHLDSRDVRLPAGDRLTTRRLQTLGGQFGMSPGFEAVHWLLDEAWTREGSRPVLSDYFLHQVQADTGHAQGALYAVLQESIYAQGHGATNWAAQRVREEFPELDGGHRDLMFTGEMMYPWMFEDQRELAPYRAATEALHRHEDFSELYDDAALLANPVPVAAVAYYHDLYVDVDLSAAQAERTGNLDLWVTSEYEHDGLRADARVLRRLIENVAGRGGPLA